MKKKMRDLVNGDIVRFEFGDYDNWVTVIVDHIERHSGYHDCKVVGKYRNSGGKIEAWGRSVDDIDIVEGE